MLRSKINTFFEGHNTFYKSEALFHDGERKKEKARKRRTGETHERDETDETDERERERESVVPEK